MKNEIKVGQIIYRHTTDGIIERTVSKVGAKYFYLDGWESRYAIDKKTLKHTNKEWTQRSFRVYLDKQEILDEIELVALSQFLRNKVGQWGIAPFSLDQLRRIKAIIDEPAP